MGITYKHKFNTHAGISVGDTAVNIIGPSGNIVSYGMYQPPFNGIPWPDTHISTSGVNGLAQTADTGGFNMHPSFSRVLPNVPSIISSVDYASAIAAEYSICITNYNNAPNVYNRFLKILVVHDGHNVSMTQFGNIEIGNNAGQITTFVAAIINDNLELQCTSSHDITCKLMQITLF